jgi:hypothetical protein
MAHHALWINRRAQSVHNTKQTSLKGRTGCQARSHARPIRFHSAPSSFRASCPDPIPVRRPATVADQGPVEAASVSDHRVVDAVDAGAWFPRNAVSENDAAKRVPEGCTPDARLYISEHERPSRIRPPASPFLQPGSIRRSGSGRSRARQWSSLTRGSHEPANCKVCVVRAGPADLLDVERRQRRSKSAKSPQKEAFMTWRMKAALLHSLSPAHAREP